MNGENNHQVQPDSEDQEIEQAEEAVAETSETEADNNETTLSEFELNEVIESLCLSKVDEFIMLGYEHVSGKDIWDCVSDKYRKTGIPPLHQIVNDILSLKSTQFMNWMTLSVYKGAQF